MLQRGRRVHSGSLCKLGSALGVVGFIRGRCVHWGMLRGSSGSSRVAGFTWVPSGSHAAPWGLSRSSGFAEFTGVRSAGRWDHPGSLGSLGGRRVHPGVLILMWCAMGVVRFIQGR